MPVRRAVAPSHLGDDLREGAAGLVADPHLVLGPQRGAHRPQLSKHRLVGEGLHAKLRPAGRVQLQVPANRRGLQALLVYKQPIGRGPIDRSEVTKQLYLVLCGG